MYTFPEIRSFRGLFLQRNSFTAPDGALEVAKNVVIPNDDVISRARGYYTYFDVSTGSLNKLFTYQEKLFAAYTDKIRYYTDTGSSPNETGSEGTITPDTGVTVDITSRTARSFQSNGNFYLTSNNGMLKLSAYNGTLFRSGAPQGLDLRGRFINGSNSTWLAAGYIVGYRVVFGYQDANDNVILGPPSEIFTVSNTAVTGKSWVRAGNVVTVTSTGHGLVTGQYIYVYASSGGSPEVVTGSYQITVTTVDAFTFAETAADDAGGNTLSYAFAMPVRLEFSVPSEITTGLTWFYQVYRSSQQLIATGIFSDFKLIEQKDLTSAEISADVVFFTDDWDDILLGAELYTNENSREGELQANFRPPLCNDVTLYKGFALYASCTTRHLKDWSVVDTTALATADFVETSISNTVRRYVARTGVGNQTVRGVCSSSSGLLVTYADHGFTNTGLWSVYIANQVGGSIANGTYYVLYVSPSTFRLASSVANWLTATAVSYNSETSLEFQGFFTSEATVAGSSWVRASDVVTVSAAAHGLSIGMQVYISNAAGGTLASGLYTLTASATNSFSFASVGSDDASGNTVDYNPYQPMFYLSTSSSASVRLADTARGIIKAVNRDSSSLVYAQYISSIDDVPGKMRFQSKGFGAAMYLRANSSGAGTAFSPILPASFSSGTQVYSRNDSQPHGFYSSKDNEPEAVPLVNFFPAGAKNAELLRVHALRDSVILLKEDGVWRVTGDNPSNFSITLLDGTVKCVAPSSSDVLNNQVIFLSNQGVCLVTENSVQIVSRKIEEVIQPILGQSTLASVTSAVAYETERLYLLTTTEPNETAATQTYCYNILTDAWTTWDDWLFTQSVIGPTDVMYYFNSTDNNIMRERKKQTKIDYCGQNHTGTVTAVASGQLSATLTLSTVTPEPGDIIVKDDVVNIITAVTTLTATSYTVTFQRGSNLVVADSVILYEGYTTEIKLAPFHGGLLGRTKQFAQMQVHFRDESCTRMNISFTGQNFGGSEETDWNAELTRAGWGEFPWGFEPWGQQSSTVLLSGSQSAPVCRIYIPLFQQRSTYIQAILQNTIAGEPLNIQAISFAVRAYNERVSK